MPASGFGGSGLYCGHALSYLRYVGIVLVGAVLAGFLESAFFMAGSWESAFFMAGFLGVGPFGAASWSRPSHSYLGGGFWEWVAF